MDLSFVGADQALWAKSTIERCLHRWRTHPDYEELCAEARMEFWRGMAQSESEVWNLREGLIRKVCRCVAHRFLTMQVNSRRKTTWYGTPVPQMVSFESFTEWHGTEPDFVPRLIERLWREEVWQAALALLTKEERRFVASWLAGEVAFSQSQHNELRRVHRLLNRYRDQVGEPLKYGGQFARTGYRQPKINTPEMERQKAAARKRRHRARMKEERQCTSF